MKSATKRATVYLDSEVHRALKIKAAEADYSISEIVNEAVKKALQEDVLDLQAFEEGRNESLVKFETVLKKLRRDGKI
ncbi:MAG TPA: CopG family transcriptional regulator [Candidatus Desulfaltia sp.]|nr:CopG family transcriptional regulator [Candidatus Desulfaltia sp.]